MNIWRNRSFRGEAVAYAAVIGLFAVIGFAFSAFSGFLTLVMGAAVFSVFYVTSHNRLDHIRKLADEIDRILHGAENYSLDRFSEGELSILESELSKMVVTLRQQSDTLKNDKLTLADSLADISHQLKTPLTSINLAVAMLSSPELTDERRLELTRDVARSLSRIEWLVSALLKMSRLDAGTAELAREQIPVWDAVDLALSPLLIAMELREIGLELDVSGEERFTGDLSWTAEALGNILKNCMEHTPRGGTISVSARENAIFTEILIRDTGEGLDHEDLPHLFERFYRGKNADAQSVGIGLALARTIIVSQGGSVKADNAAGGGARFTVRFYKSAV